MGADPPGARGPSSTGSGATAASTSIRTGPPTSTRRSRRTWPSGSPGSRPTSEPLRRARDTILGLGGIQEANSYVRINLSLFGLYPKRHVPTIPVELALVPGGLIYEMSSWTRAIVMPLSIIQAKTDTRPVPAGFNLDELVVPGKTFKLPKRDRLSALFRQLDVALKVWESRGPEMIRRAGHSRGREVDPRSHPQQRRPRRDLSRP